MTTGVLQSIGTALILDVSRYGYAALAAGVLMENAGVPVPGETMLLAAAGLAARGRLSIVLVALVAVSAAVAGDNIGFALGRLGGRPLIERFGPWVFVTRERLDAVDGFFRKRGPLAVFGARFVPAVRVVAALAAGSSAIPWRTFLVFNALGAVVWAIAVSATGFLGADVVAAALPWLRTAHLGIWGLLVLAVVVLAAHFAFEAAHEGRVLTAARTRRHRRGSRGI